MNNPTSTRKTTPTYKGGKASNPRDPRRSQEILSVEELGVYSSSSQIDPWLGQLVQIGWNYCV